MASKESTCEGGDVRWCAPEKKKNNKDIEDYSLQSR